MIFPLSVSFGLLVAISLLSYFRGEGLEKDFLIAGARSVLQLILLGLVLGQIFASENYLIVLLVGCFMTVNAALHSKSRVQVKYPSLFLDNLVAIALAIWPLAFIGAFLLKSDPWWKVEILLPLLGMLLGNTLNGISLAIDNFGSELKSRREEIVSLVAIGASPQEATQDVMKRSLKVGMTPILNAMASMGVVSIPGMMTGQLLAGQSPVEAALVQIVIVLLISIGAYGGTSIALSLSRKKKFSAFGIPCFE